MKRVVLDVESDNVTPYVSKIHVVCTLDLDSGEMKSYRDRGSLIANAADYSLVVTHFGLGFDFWALQKVWDIPFTVGKQSTFNRKPVELIDTLVLSRYLNPDRDGHGLDAWGKRLGFSKTDWNDFSEYSEEMEAYCENDVRLTAKVFNVLMEEMNRVSN